MIRWTPHLLLLLVMCAGLAWPDFADWLPGAQVLLSPTSDQFSSVIIAVMMVGMRAGVILLVPGLTGAALVYRALRPPLDLIRPVQGGSPPEWPPGSRAPSSNGSDRPPS
ncbi:MAG: hypothetical protein ACI9MC_002416 [Kiritimatiellia bacterium]|jgi:hypothetical protein